MTKGKFIALYGINNLGKTTQAKKLVNYFKNKELKAEYLKYAVYDLEPSGKLLNDYLRNGNPYNLSSREFQILQVLNRQQYEPILIDKLNKGINIISEDYKGTGIAWGIAAGVDETFMKYVNKCLLEEDLVFLFDGERFLQGVEKNHMHENDKILTNKSRQAHLKLAKELGWEIINANRPEEDVTEGLIKIINSRFNI